MLMDRSSDWYLAQMNRWGSLPVTDCRVKALVCNTLSSVGLCHLLGSKMLLIKRCPEVHRQLTR